VNRQTIVVLHHFVLLALGVFVGLAFSIDFDFFLGLVELFLSLVELFLRLFAVFLSFLSLFLSLLVIVVYLHVITDNLPIAQFPGLNSDGLLLRAVLLFLEARLLILFAINSLPVVLVLFLFLLIITITVSLARRGLNATTPARARP
jgi:hypothetical protein